MEAPFVMSEDDFFCTLCNFALTAVFGLCIILKQASLVCAGLGLKPSTSRVAESDTHAFAPQTTDWQSSPV